MRIFPTKRGWKRLGIALAILVAINLTLRWRWRQTPTLP